MYDLKVYTPSIYVANYGDTVANHGSVYRPCLNYQKEEWEGHYSRPLNICILVILEMYIYIYTHIKVHQLEIECSKGYKNWFH